MIPYCWKYSMRGGEEGNREKFVKKRQRYQRDTREREEQEGEKQNEQQES